MFPAKKGIFYKVSESICSKLRYNNKLSNISSFPGCRCIPKRLQHTNVNKLLFRRGGLNGKVNTNEISNANCFSILGTDNNDTHFSLEKNYYLSNHRFDMQSYGSRIVGSCNGILCLQDHLELENVVLWNPVTDELKPLPPSSIVFPTKAPYKLVGSSAFGFDARSEDYKVVRFVENGFFNDDYRTTHHFELYSLKTDSWRPIVNPVSLRYPTRYPLHIYSVSLNGSCYWEAGNCILSFDFADEVFSYLPLPRFHDIETHKDVVCCLVAIDGSTLGLISYTFKVRTKIFDLLVWKSKEWRWRRVDIFELEDIRTPLGLWGGDKCFLVDENHELLLFDLKTRELKSLGIKDHLPWAMSVVPFVESTVSIKRQ
ncbi:hypothetical protein CASFOL_035798 [Castilleja foliolosa]|uniref:F-box associated beta-propeller type 1 domain-containing protein n=1 Tax=Castilleja foliolosa TaxID=1961234 RepID=A0ABD3BTP7_9LAMI